MISDAELISELHRSGRPATIDLLATLRRSNLVPPLKTRGLGRGKGKAFYSDGNILSRAKFAYDAMIEFGDTRQALWCLWVAGFDVAETRLKRIWIYRLSRKHRWAVPRVAIARKRSEDREKASTRIKPEGLAVGLAGAFALFEPLSIRDDWLRWSAFVEASIKIGAAFASEGPDHGTGEIAKLARFLPLILDAAERSDLVWSASASELNRARDLARNIGRIAAYDGIGLFRIEPEPPYWAPYFAANIGTPLIICILLLERAGLIDHIAATARLIEQLVDTRRTTMDWRSFRRRVITIWRNAA